MESNPEQVAEGLVVVRVLGRVLEKLVAANVNLAEADQGLVTKFHALKAPSIGILQYLERIHKYASCSTECFILALIYIDRLIQGNNFVLTELNVHRVAITSILLAAKFFDDAYYNNAYYAKVGGVLVTEMNRLEVEFLFRINFSLHVSPELYNKYHAELGAHAAGENPTSGCVPFSKAAEISKPKRQVELISCNHVEINEPMGSSQSQGGDVLQSEQEICAPDESHHYVKQFIPGIPGHITPSPPIVQVNYGGQHHPQESVNVPEQLFPSESVQDKRKILLQPQLRYPWTAESDQIDTYQNGLKSYSNGKETSATRYAPSIYDGPTSCNTDDTSSIIVEYSYYGEDSKNLLPNTHTSRMIAPNFTQYQPQTVSTTPGSDRYNRSGSISGWQ